MNKIKYLILDIDGTLTDGKIYIGTEGELFKAFDAKDGYGIINILIPAGITPIVITGRKSKIVTNRCGELGIEAIFQGVSDKLSLLKSLNIDFANVAQIGDDMNDYNCMVAVRNSGGIIGCPSNAVCQVKDISNYICNKKGGNGAVREFIEYITNYNKSQ